MAYPRWLWRINDIITHFLYHNARLTLSCTLMAYFVLSQIFNNFLSRDPAHDADNLIGAPSDWYTTYCINNKVNRRNSCWVTRPDRQTDTLTDRLTGIRADWRTDGRRTTDWLTDGRTDGRTRMRTLTLVSRSGVKIQPQLGIDGEMYRFSGRTL